MEVLSTLYYFLITIAVLVIVHEFGHFITAKMFGMRAEVFSVGFGKRLFGWNKIEGFYFGDQRDTDLGDHTDYRLCLLPFGGYVKISGMIDESNDTDYLAHEPKPWEFRSKAAWKKAIVISAGVTMNVLLAIGIYVGVRYTNPVTLWQTTTIARVAPASSAEKVGLKVGDKILSVAGVRVETWDEVLTPIIADRLTSDVTLSIERAGARQTIVVAAPFRIPDKTSPTFGISPEHVHPVILGVTSGDPAEKAGFKAGDVIHSVDGIPLISREEMVAYIGSHAGKEIIFERVRDGVTERKAVTPNANGKIGIYPGDSYDGPVRMKESSFAEALPAGFLDMKRGMTLIVSSIGQLITGEVSGKELAGPIKIAQMAANQARDGAVNFLLFMAILSLNLALINILPFPALDGGHLLFIAVEAVIRREISSVVKIRIQQVGVTLLLALMVFIVYNDILHF